MGIPLLGLSTGPNTSPLAIPDELAARGAAIGMEVTTERRAVLKTRLLPASEFDKIPATQWDALSGKALVENPFYARKYTLGGLSTIDDGKRLSAFTVWSCEQNLIGFFPLRNYFGHGCGARNIYQFNGAPLVHNNHAEDVVRAWLLAIRAGQLPSCWQLPNLQLDGRLHDLISCMARQLGLSVAVLNPYRRPQLTRLEGGFETHLDKVLSKSRRKELERCLRRLREKGLIRLERASGPEAVRSALEVFLKLENAGWKGRAGTAFLARNDDASFARAVFTTEGDGQGTIIDTLLLDDQPIAISVNITSGSTLFTPKCTYSESLRSFAPGLVLEYLVIQQFYSEFHFARMDAATTADGHVVQGLWNENVPMGTLFVGLREATARAVCFTRAKTALKTKAKLLFECFRSA